MLIELMAVRARNPGAGNEPGSVWGGEDRRGGRERR